MNCKYLSLRTKKNVKYVFCKCKKKDIDFQDCCNCVYKEYRKSKISKMKKHTRTKYTNISKKVKIAVWNRDQHKCIFCGNPVPVSCANSHYIPRSQGGLGIEQNIVTACPKCHHEQDNGIDTEYYDIKAKRYLQAHYGDLSKINLIYTKYKTKEGE